MVVSGEVLFSMYFYSHLTLEKAKKYKNVDFLDGTRLQCRMSKIFSIQRIREEEDRRAQSFSEASLDGGAIEHPKIRKMVVGALKRQGGCEFSLRRGC